MLAGRGDLIAVAQAVVPVLRNHAARVDEEACFPTESVAALRDSGLLGLLVPVEHGGGGATLRQFVEVAGILASGCLSTAMIWAMHCQQTDALVRFGTPGLRDSLLPALARGGVYVASITTEPGKGGHLLKADAALGTPVGSSGLRTFEREAPVVTGGEYADGFLITLREAPDSPGNRVSLVYADRRQLRVETLGRPWNPLGMRATHSVGMRLSGAIPDDQIVGDPGEFRSVAIESMIPIGHLGWAACWLGAARSTLAEFIGLIRSPKRPRQLDPQSELVAERLARIRMDLEVVNAYLYRVVDEVDAARTASTSLNNPATQIHINTLKVVAAERCYQAVDRMVQLSGLSTGYLRDSVIPMERQLRDLRSASLNNSDDRLLTATGALSLLDRAVRLV